VGDEIALLRFRFLEPRESGGLRRGCHLYGNLEADKEKTREREAKIGKKRLTGGRGWRRERKERRAKLNLPSRGRVRVLARRDGGGGGTRTGPFSEGGLHAAAGTARKASFASLEARRDVWRQFHCAFHSVGRFEIQARTPFVLRVARATRG